ncbi:histidine phosphatase family protein [Nonomuraea sp. JJY05]|uniref:histidine phosphatase family protein n=1 Tax=Nonomuraea sp. JJY05 TaxID=3350255 RepID=UPI00373F35AA
MAVTLVCEAHSITVDNENGIATGWLPGELSARGRALAVEVGARRKAVDVVHASDLWRAVETAEIAFAGSGRRSGSIGGSGVRLRHLQRAAGQ